MFKRIVRKGYFTLIELLIVIFIISLGVILTGVKVKGLYDEQRFYSEAQQVLGHLSMAQDLMLIMDADVDVKISRDSDHGGVQVQLEVEKPFDHEQWARFIERKLSLPSIRSLTFDGARESNLKLKFSLGGMSKGTLTLYEGSGSSDERHYAIVLAGYPRPLKGTSKEEPQKGRRDRDAAEKGKALYPEEVYKKLYEDPNQEAA
jgi:hypothetical protein